MTDATFLAECRSCLCLASRSAARRVTAVYDRHLRTHGLRSTQFSILSNLAVRGPTLITALAGFLGMDRTTLTRNLALLESNGWVDVRPEAGDARTRLVSVTRSGLALARKALPAWRAAQHEVAGAFGPAGVAALHKLANTPLG